MLINGYLSKGIIIERGVKQVDALSCALFILFVDSLLSTTKLTKTKVNNRAGGFTNDINVIFRGDQVCSKNL